MTRFTLALFFCAGVTAGACTVEMDDGDGVDTTAAADTSVGVVDTAAASTAPPSDTAPATPRRSADARLLPVDEGAQDPSFLAFRLRMLEAVGARDTTFLFDRMDDGVRISFGADGGKQGFRDMWDPADPESDVWKILGRVLGGGGLLREGSTTTGSGGSASAMFQAPYYYAAFPGEEYDAFTHGVILEADVPVRDKPYASASAIDTLSFAIVRVPDFMPRETDHGRWVRIDLGGGRFGYVPEPLIQSPIGYRAVFHKINGRWTMTALVAGD